MSEYRISEFKDTGEILEFLAKGGPGLRVVSIFTNMEGAPAYKMLWENVPYQDRDAQLVEDLQKWIDDGHTITELLSRLYPAAGDQNWEATISLFEDSMAASEEVLRVPESVGFVKLGGTLFLPFGTNQFLGWEPGRDNWCVAFAQGDPAGNCEPPRLVECQAKDLKPGDWFFDGTTSDDDPPIGDPFCYSLYLGGGKHVGTEKGELGFMSRVCEKEVYKLVLDE